MVFDIGKAYDMMWNEGLLIELHKSGVGRGKDFKGFSVWKKKPNYASRPRFLHARIISSTFIFESSAERTACGNVLLSLHLPFIFPWTPFAVLTLVVMGIGSRDECEHWWLWWISRLRKCVKHNLYICSPCRREPLITWQQNNRGAGVHLFSCKCDSVTGNRWNERRVRKGKRQRCWLGWDIWEERKKEAAECEEKRCEKENNAWQIRITQYAREDTRKKNGTNTDLLIKAWWGKGRIDFEFEVYWQPLALNCLGV